MVAKYKKEPICCLKCHSWSHIVAECAQRYDRCGTCGGRGHQTSTHTSNMSNARWTIMLVGPENALLLLGDVVSSTSNIQRTAFHTMEPWTWAEEPWQEPTQTYRPASPPPIRVQPGTQRLRQQELNFATRSNAVPVALSQGSIRQWGNPDPSLLLGQQ